ncbi:MAG: riboflavin synthase subunit alpha [marine bacterium B5-7]|nr:MAG: riboflavin synthase subunit alpha [marine bacterium B5-7]
MFTGIIQTTGEISAIDAHGSDSRFVFSTGNMDLTDLKVGDSIAVNGACLTIIDKDADCFAADLSNETLKLTTFSKLGVGSRINLEKAMQLSDRLNGHMVSGHVDGIGQVIDLVDDARSVRYTIEVPATLSRYLSKKGSVTVDGVSLTINTVEGSTFSVNIIPHTLSETIFSGYETGSRVNIEVDLIARYLDQLIVK